MKQELAELKLKINQTHKKLTVAKGDVVKAIKTEFDSQISSFKQNLVSQIIDQK